MFINFEEVKAANPIADVVERLGLQYNKSGKSWRMKCPACEGSGDRNLVVTPEKGVYFCFSDSKGGDQLQLVSHIKGIAVKEAAAWLLGEQPSREKKGEKSEGFSPLTYLEPEHEAVQALGFEPGDADRLGIGFAPRGMLKGHVVVPIRLADGKLTGYIGIQDCKLPPSFKF